MNAVALPQPVHSLVVLRALMLGDMICATPALRALRAAFPAAQLVLVGTPGMQAWAERQTCIDEFVAFPGWRGLPETPPPAAAVARRFVGALRERRFDLAVQLHGSGSIVNPLVVSFGARANAGFAGLRAWRPPADRQRFCRWPEQGREQQRLLALTDHLGLPRQGEHLDFPLLPADHAAARALLPPGCGAYAVVHVGSQLPSRRWPPERFAAVADALAARGLAVLLTGSAGEAELTAATRRAMRAPAHDLAGATTLWTLGALVGAAAVVVCNDTGISHIAAALGTPSAVVASGSDVARWAPLAEQRHRVFWHDMPCRPCAEPVCPSGNACALGVAVAPVARAALELLEQRP